MVAGGRSEAQTTGKGPLKTVYPGRGTRNVRQAWVPRTLRPDALNVFRVSFNCSHPSRGKVAGFAG